MSQSDLTPSLRRVLDLIAQGKTNADIAAELYLAEKTVKNRVSEILLLLGVRNRTEAALLWITQGGLDVRAGVCRIEGCGDATVPGLRDLVCRPHALSITADVVRMTLERESA